MATPLNPVDLDVAYSNETEHLVHLLAARLITLRDTPGANPFALSTIAVPNLNLAQWIQFRLAEQMGVAAGLDFIFLEKVFRKVISANIPNARIIDKGLLQALLIEFFRSEPWNGNSKLEPVRRYLSLETPQGREREASQRLFDLTSALAKAFDDYAMSRRDLLTRWKKNETSLSKQNRSYSTEIWQREIWRVLFMPGGHIEALSKTLGQRMGMLGDLFNDALQAPAASPKSVARIFGSEESIVHIFGFSYVASAYFDMLSTLSHYVPVRIYTLNPCREFWEDVETLKEEHRRAKRFRVAPNRGVELEGDDPFSLCAPSGENLLLRLWGRPGRENIRVLNALTNCTFTEIFNDSMDEDSCMLAQIRSAMLHRQTAPALPVAPDHSLVYLRCRGGIRREVETVANEIWRLVAESGSGSNRMRFNDVAIIVGASAKEQYESAIRSVFDECHRLPYRMADASSRSQSPLVDALFTLFESSFGEMNRSTLLRFLTHPAVVARHQGDVDVWTSLAQEAHIYVGADAGDLANTYIDRDLYNWDQGLLRLALGTFMSGDRLGDTRLLALGENRYIPVDSSPGVRRHAERFVVLARSLLADLKFLRTRSCHAGEWANFFSSFVHTYLGTYEGEPASESDMRSSCAKAAQDMVEFDCGPNSHFDGFTALQFFSESLARIKPGQAGFLVDGVVVASFLPMRPIPFRAIFVVGMGEGKFPTADSLNELDLRSAKRRASDVSPREQDKYMFLETILSCRERLYISWIARDEVSDDPIQPSGIVKELNQALLEMGLPLESLPRLERTIPHRRFDPSLFTSQESLSESLPPMLFPEAWREFAAVSQRGVQNANEPEASLTQPTAAAGPIRCDTFALWRFLDNPLLALAEQRYGIRIEEFDDPVEVSDEPHHSNEREQRKRLESILNEAWSPLSPAGETRTKMLLETHRNLYERAQLAGKTPAGILAESEVKAEQRELASKSSLIDLWCKEFNTNKSMPISLGRTRGTTSENHPPLRLFASKGREIEISTELNLRFLGPDQALLITPMYGSGTKLQLGDQLRLFLSLCIAVAAGHTFPEKTIFSALPKDFSGGNYSSLVSTFQTPTQNEALAWLSTLVEMWLDENQASYLPATLLEEKRLSPFLGSDKEGDIEVAQSMIEEIWEKMVETAPGARGNRIRLKLHQMLGDAELYPPPPQALALLRRRFQLFLEMRPTPAEKKSAKGGKS